MRTTSEAFLNMSSVDPRNLLEEVAGNAAAASRTATINLDKNYSHVIVELETSRSAHTAAVITVKKSMDGGTTFSSITSSSIAAGAAIVSNYVETYTQSSDITITREYDVRGVDAITVLVALTAGGASDTITVRASGTRV